MLITPDFVLLNFPKTGSSFTRQVVKTVYGGSPGGRLKRGLAKAGLCEPPFRELFFPNIRLRVDGLQEDQHGTYRQIPGVFRRLPVVAVARNPFDRYVSKYKFRYWQSRPIPSLEEVRRVFPGFPDLSFEQFLDYEDFLSSRYRIPGLALNPTPGGQTVEFAMMFFTDPSGFLKAACGTGLDQDGLIKALPPIRFLRMERLNRDLYNFLEDAGVSRRRIRFILQTDRIQPPEGTSRKPGDRWQDYYSPALLEKVYRKDRILFDLLGALGVGEPESWPGNRETSGHG